jgi:hypothetical protein
MSVTTISRDDKATVVDVGTYKLCTPLFSKLLLFYCHEMRKMHMAWR